MKGSLKKSISMLLSLLMLLSVFVGAAFTASAEDAELHEVILRGNAERYADSVTVSVSPAQAREGELVTLTIRKTHDCATQLRIPYCYFSTDVNSQPYEHSYNEYESYEWDPVTGEFIGTFRMPAQDIYVWYYIGDVDVQHEYGAWVYSRQEATEDGDVYTGDRVCAVCGAADPETRSVVLKGNADRYADDVNVSVSADEATAGELVTLTIQKTGACAAELRIPYCYFSTDVNSQPYEHSYSEYESYEWDPVTGEFTGTFRMSAQTMYVWYFIGEVDYAHTPGETVYDNFGPYSSGDAKTECDASVLCAVCGQKISTERIDAYHYVNSDNGGPGCNVTVYQDASAEQERSVPYAVPGERVYFSVSDSFPCMPLKAVIVSIWDWGNGSEYLSAHEEPIAFRYHGNNLYSFVMPHYPVKIQVSKQDVGCTYRELRRENEVKATCTEAGSYDLFEECIYCGSIEGPTHIEVPALGHTEGKATVENFVLPTTEAQGGYDLVVRCALCGEEMSREHTVLDKLTPSDDHVPGAPVVENYVEPTAEKEGSFDIVVYCADCDAELSRETITLDKLTPGETPDDPTPADNAGLCKYCGEDHSGSFMQRIIGFFHSILYFFSHLFGKM